MNRSPVVAGTFYPGSKTQWETEVRGYLGPPVQRQSAVLAMLPHAGYVYSGSIAGQTLAQLNLPETVLLLGPNHTGAGAPYALWASGRWNLPGAHLDVNESLARELLHHVPRIQADEQAHLREHSLEVLLPFLWVRSPEIQILPLAVADPDLDRLLQTAQAMSAVLARHNHPVLILVSSDMSHFLSADKAKAQDSMALQAIMDRDPRALHATVRARNISMCGVLPMTLGLEMANALGASQARIVAYGTSGDASGDYAKVVAYAGVIVE